MITNVWPETIRHVRPILTQTIWNVLVHKRPITYTELPKLKVNLVFSEFWNVYPKANYFYSSRLIFSNSLNIFFRQAEQCLLAGTSRVYIHLWTKIPSPPTIMLKIVERNSTFFLSLLCPMLYKPFQGVCARDCSIISLHYLTWRNPEKENYLAKGKILPWLNKRYWASFINC